MRYVGKARRAATTPENARDLWTADFRVALAPPKRHFMAEAVRVFLQFLTRMMNPRRRRLVGRWLIGGAIYSLAVIFAAGAGGALGYDGEVLGVTLAMALMPLCLGNVIVLGLFILWGER